MKPGYVLLVIGIAMLVMTAIFTQDSGVMDTLCEALWEMLQSPKFWTIGGYVWGALLVLLGIMHLVGETEDKS